MLDKQDRTKVAETKIGNSSPNAISVSDNLSFTVQIKSNVNLQLAIVTGIHTYIYFLKIGLRYPINKFTTLTSWYCIKGIADDVKADGTSVHQMTYR